jgi:hypothetical protein
MAVLQTLVNEFPANIVVEQGVDKIGGILFDMRLTHFLSKVIWCVA